MAYDEAAARQAYLNWQRETGGNWGGWYAGAPDFGVAMHRGDEEMRALGYHDLMTPWGENKWLDASGNDISAVNPAWMTAFDAWKAAGGTQQQQASQQNPPGGQAGTGLADLPPLTFENPLSLYHLVAQQLPTQQIQRQVGPTADDELRRLGIY